MYRYPMLTTSGECHIPQNLTGRTADKSDTSPGIALLDRHPVGRVLGSLQPRRRHPPDGCPIDRFLYLSDAQLHCSQLRCGNICLSIHNDSAFGMIRPCPGVTLILYAYL